MVRFTRERLLRLRLLLRRLGGSETVRQLDRLYSVRRWEVEEAARLGWVEIVTQRPRVGRPSRVVRELSETPAAKLPPYRSQIPREVSYRHQIFAQRCAQGHYPRGLRLGRTGMGLPPYWVAYAITFLNAKSKVGIAASTSRLLRHRDVKAALAWHTARWRGRVPRDEAMPLDASSIWWRLRSLGAA